MEKLNFDSRKMKKRSKKFKQTRTGKALCGDFNVQEAKKEEQRPQEIERDLAVLRKLAGRAANHHQVQGVFATFGALSAYPRARSLLHYFLSDKQDSYERYQDIKPRDLMLLIEPRTKHGSPHYSQTIGWWNGEEKLIERLEEAVHQPQGKLEGDGARILKKLFKKTGRETDFVGVASLMNLMTDNANLDRLCFVLKGRKASTPYDEQEEELVDYLHRRIDISGADSSQFANIASLVNALIEGEAPEELWETARKVVRRQWDKEVNAWIPSSKEILRYARASEEEKEYIRTVVETARLWKNEQHWERRFVEGLKDPLFYKFLTAQIKRGLRTGGLNRIAEIFSVLEEHPETVGLVSLGLTGKKMKLEFLLNHIHEQGFPFIGGKCYDEGTGNRTVIETPLPQLAELAVKQPPRKVIDYFYRALKSGAALEDIDYLMREFPLEFKGKNKGARAIYSSSCMGKLHEKSREIHAPFISRKKEDVITRGADALKRLYDDASGFKHKIIIGEHVIPDRQDERCYTAAFVNEAKSVVHVVFPNSMMFDPNVKEENCSGCSQIALCRGMEEYSSAVLFDYDKFGFEFLHDLERTVPGVFELHDNKDGVHKLGNFVLFPERAGIVYYNPLLTPNFTPVSTERPLGNMVVFPFNLEGSSYLAKSLRTRTKTLPEIDRSLYPNEVIIDRKEFGRMKEADLRERLVHFTGREIGFSREAEKGIIYHPSIDFEELKRDLERGANAGGSADAKKPVSIRALYGRSLM